MGGTRSIILAIGINMLVGLTAALTGDARLFLIPILSLFLVGVVLLWRVDLDVSRAAARSL